MSWIGTAAGTVALLTALGSGVLAIESRYVSTADFQDFTGQYLRGEIRDLEREIREEPDPVLRKFLEDELEELLEEYCADYPDDHRRCEE